MQNAPASFDAVEPQIRSSLQAAQVPNSTAENIIGQARTCYVDMARAKDSSEQPESCKKLSEPQQTTISGSAKASMTSEQVAALEKAQTEVAETVKTTLSSAVKEANTKNFISAFGVAVVFELIILALVFGLSFTLPRHISAEAMQEG